MTAGEFPWGQLLTVVGTLLGTLVGAFANHVVTRKKHAREKTWERRADAYSQIVSALTRAQRLGALVTGSYSDYPEGNLSEWGEARERELWESHRAAFDAMEASFILMSPEMISAMQAFEDARDAVDRETYSHAVHDAEMEIFDKFIPRIVATARREIVP